MVFKQTALRLLDCDFPDGQVRAFAIRVLRRVPDEQLEDFLLQLTQVNIVSLHTQAGKHISLLS